MWRLRKNSFVKKWKFIPAELEEGIAYIKNPFRGWYTLYSFAIEESVDFEELRWCLKEEESIALVLVDIGSYRERALDFEAIQNFSNILHFFKQYEKDIILRLVYDREGRGLEKEPENLSLILEHIRQIGELLNQQEHTVFLMQGLLIGSWGEMHSSKYTSPSDMKKLYQEVRKCLGKEMMLAVRTPSIWRNLISEEAYEKKEFAQLGLFDDALFSSKTDMGTYGFAVRESGNWKESWIRWQEISFAEEICRKVPFGGEVVARVEEMSVKVLQEMKQLHLSYLNSAYDENVLDEWKTMPYDAVQSYYDYVGMQMGYRYVVRTVKLESHRLSITIENTGFGLCPEEIDLWIQIENGEKIQAILVKEDLSRLESGEQKEFTIRFKPIEGVVYLYACTRKSRRKILFANKGSVPLVLGKLSL